MNTALIVEFHIVPRAELSQLQANEMFELFSHHFEGVTLERFREDLAEKHLALLLQRGNALVGFSTLLAYSTRFEGQAINVIYSGDTVVTPEAWGSTALPRAWVAGVNALRATLPPGRCFWILLTSGFRTYRFLPVFWREFFPRFDAVTPPELRRLIHGLAAERFGEQYDFQRGIVRFAQPQRLRAGLQVIPPGRQEDPHVAFFLASNPGWLDGDELVCLTELCPENLTAAGRRMMPSPAYAAHSNAG